MFSGNNTSLSYVDKYTRSIFNISLSNQSCTPLPSETQIYWPGSKEVIYFCFISYFIPQGLINREFQSLYHPSGFLLPSLFCLHWSICLECLLPLHWITDLKFLHKILKSQEQILHSLRFAFSGNFSVLTALLGIILNHRWVFLPGVSCLKIESALPNGVI